MTQSNPAIPRLRYVAKNYSAGVLYLATKAWLEAVGADYQARALRASVVGDPNLDEDAAKELILLHIEHPAIALPTATRYDRYIPWLAKALNDTTKSLIKKLPREMAMAPMSTTAKPARFAHLRDRRQKPTLLALLQEPPNSPTSPFFGAGESWLAQWFGGLDLAERLLVPRFRALVNWAEAENVDLGKYTPEDAMLETNRWSSENIIAAAAEQAKVVFEWPDGWKVQELRTEAQLEEEGEIMQHCVGDGGYADPIAEGVTRILSLRDPQGRPHATMEWDVELNYAVQIKGKQNDAPKPEYTLRMVEFRLRELQDDRGEMDEVPATDWPDHADGFQASFMGFYAPSGRGARSGWAYYTDGSILDYETIETYVGMVRDDCIDSFTDQENGRVDRAGLDQCIVDTLDSVAPQDVDNHREMVPSTPWWIWRKTGYLTAPDVADDPDEMVQAMESHVQSYGREFTSKLQNLRQPGRPQTPNPSRRRMADLKRKLMR